MPVEVVKGRILAGWARKYPEPYIEPRQGGGVPMIGENRQLVTDEPVDFAK